MKKVILSIALVAFATGAFAQKKVVSAAEKNFKKGDLELALTEIDAALDNPETKDNPETPLLKARILTKKFGQDSSNVASTVETGRAALEQFTKAMEMSGNDKESKVGKEVYKEEIPDLGENFRPYSIRTLKNSAFEKAIVTYENEDMEMAYEFFNLMSDIDPTDTTASFNAGYIANDIGNYEDAKKQFKKLIEVKEYNKLSAYYLLIQIISGEDKEPEEAYKYVTRARADYPDDKTLSEFEVQLLLQMNKMDEAMASVKEALVSDPNNAGLLLRYGYLLEQSGDKAGALEEYKKSVVADPNFFEGNYYTGAIFLDQAREILSKINDLTDDEWEKNAPTMTKQAEGLYAESVQYFEKGLSLRPDNVEIMEILYNVHVRLKNTAEVEKYNKMLVAKLGADWMEK
ncbi:tetratricopeptide repeat protein [Aquiflexum sp. LQ15W]|uniref:tetratricopeptide repeat protein n=1 Tax=Cognataquiflexum nitidum TaxID=2922272 RepID=UPI001F13C712|nr:tetratricopeptide repeat protein [Cognataquiflexum nitidum]MCH6200951.1 tetratricopeptide repeat protein [Cognataquiflexum nitidum]